MLLSCTSVNDLGIVGEFANHPFRDSWRIANYPYPRFANYPFCTLTYCWCYSDSIKCKTRVLSVCSYAQ